jgi:signal transduction histidine kinase
MNIPHELHSESIGNIQGTLQLSHKKAFAISDTSGNLLYTNDSFQGEFSGLKRRNISEFSGEPELLRVVKKLAESNHNSLDFEFFFHRPDAIGDRLYNVNIEKFVLEEKLLFYLFFSSLEIQKTIDEKINNLHYAIDYGEVAVLICDFNGYVKYSSSTFEKIIGKNIEQIYNKFLPDVLENVITGNEKAQIMTAILRKSKWVSIISGTDKNSNVWFKELKLTTIPKSDPAHSNFLLTANDITNYILKNRVVEQSEQKQRLIINSITDLLIIARKEGDDLIFENGNDNFFTIFAGTREKIKDKPLRKILPQTLCELVEDTINNYSLFETGHAECTYSNHASGREYIMKVGYAVDTFYNDKLFIISLNDITERINYEKELLKTIEKENQLNRLKDAFIANMSHEIRTPATAIIGYSNFLEEDIESQNFESAVEFSKLLKEGVTRLVELLEKIMELSLLDSDDYQLDLNIYDIKSLLDKSFRQFKPLAENQYIELKVEVDRHNALIETDQLKFSKTLEMLIDNAIKYNVENGTVILKSELHDDKVTISIIDTGRGIDEKRLEAILSPFVQEELEGHKRNYEGAGLGLTLASKLTKALKGTFEIKSEKGRGTTVSLTFPVIDIA